MKRLLLLPLLLWITVPHQGQGLFEETLDTPSAATNNLPISGSVRSELFIGQDPPSGVPLLQSAFTAINLETRFSSGTYTAYAEGRLRLGREFDQPLASGILREGWIKASVSPLSFTIGRQILNWNHTGMTNPAGEITPVNTLLRTSLDDERNLGQWMVKTDLNLSPASRLSLVWMPLYTSSVLMTRLAEYPGFVSFEEPSAPAMELRNSSGALRYQRYGDRMDAGLTLFYGYHHWPGIDLTDLTNDSVSGMPVSAVLQEKPYQLFRVKGYASIPLPGSLIRIETAWQKSPQNESSTPPAPLPEIRYAAEWEITRSTLTLLAGYSGKHVLDYTNPPQPNLLAGDFDPSLFSQYAADGPGALQEQFRQQVVAFNRLMNYQMKQFYHSLYLAAQCDLLHNTLSIHLPVMYTLTSEEFSLHPALEASLSDQVAIKTGAGLLTGPQESLFELVGPALNAGYLSIRVTF